MSKKMNILVTGANGQLGKEIEQLSTSFPDYNFHFTDVDTLNITDAKALDNFMDKNKVNFIINCAAYTAVDKAETEKDQAFLLNAVAVDFLVDAAIRANAYLIHISTDYVFDGSKNTPYEEEDVAIPNSMYGESKNEGEKLILYSDANAVIIRTSWLYSTFGNNFVKTMLKLGAEKEELNVVFDQVGSPTYARDLGKAILDILPQLEISDNPYQELFHYTNEGVCSWFDLAMEIFRQKEIKCKVHPVESDAFPTPAKRPHYSVLNKAKIRSEFNIEIPHWVDSLSEMLKNLDNK